jgi:hypothetical protein
MPKLLKEETIHLETNEPPIINLEKKDDTKKQLEDAQVCSNQSFKF